ncbi:lipase family protein [Oceanobacter mangrovi]|uniref:lipase family protein n=1 Tax=Oceanobacter mangrovi TaxID=2862510 RepID=UPI001C8D3E63|nr:lipase family protein [Oceanobacter mangrovi]
MFSPNEAATLARDVYELTEGDKFAAQRFINNPIFSKNRFIPEGKLEMGSLSQTTPFGLFTRGAGNIYGNHLIVIFRGTSNITSGIGDWLTNLNIGCSISSTGHYVHAGFNSMFNSMVGQLESFVRSQKGIDTVHCIGHSLGGALATLAADWFKSNTQIKPILYTFGAPRVGHYEFATAHTVSMLPENINRVVHGTDVVPMIPLFPFFHAPTSGLPCYIATGNQIGGEWHGMRHYVTTVSSHRSWKTLRQPAPLILYPQIKYWLKEDKVVNFNGVDFWNKLYYSFIYLCNRIIGNPINSLVSSAATALDVMASIIHKGLNSGGEASEDASLLIKKLAKALGMTVVETSVQFIRNALEKLMQRMSIMVKEALDRNR